MVESTSSVQSDEIGNITNVDDMELVWEGRQLQSIGANGTPYFSYEYNIDGQRTKKTITDFDTGETTTTEYFYNSGMLMGQKTGNDVLVFMYDENGDIFGFTYNGTPYYYVKNAQNDVWAVTNADGQAVALYFYDAWGKVTRSYEADGYEAIAEVNPILYRSYYCDLEFGFYYLNTRYYAPTLHRFLNADGYVQTGQGLLDKNMFVYCLNNPVRFYDLSGNYCISIPAQGNDCTIVIVNDDEYVSVTEDNGLYTVESRPKPNFATQIIVAQTIYGEGGGRMVYDDWQDGQRAVATIIVNRVSSPNYSDDFAEVCMQKAQFNGYTSGKEAYETGTYDPIMWDYAMSLAADVVTGTLMPHPSMNSQYLYFHSQSYGDQTTIDRIKAKEETVYAGGNMFYITWP